MRIYNYLESPEGYDFCGIPTVKPLSMYDVIPIEHRYFDESSYLAKTPSYVWYNSDNEIKAFVLNTESVFEDIGLGVKIVGYRDLLFA